MNKTVLLPQFALATILTTAALTASAQVTVSGRSVPAKAEIYGAGNAGLPDASGLPPVEVDVPANASTLTFILINGRWTLNGGANYNDPDGVGSEPATSSINAYGGLSGITTHGAGMLTGVFTTASGPSGAAPATLDFTQIGTSFTSFSPLLNQVFFIGDGLTGDGTGSVQQFTVPAGATKLYLGAADASYYQGSPGAYGDNSGSYAVSLEFLPAGVPVDVITFTNQTTDTNWNNPANWSPNQVPGPMDTAVIRGGTVGITDSASVGALYLGGGILSAPYGLNILSGGSWNGGRLNGMLSIAAGANFTLNNAGGTLDLPETTLVNNGTVTWSAGTLRGDGSTLVTNNGTWIISGVNDEFDNAYGGLPVFVNNSSFIVQNGSAQTVTFSGVEITNDAPAGTPIDAQSGTLLFEGGGYLNGAFQAETGGHIKFDQVPGLDIEFFTGPNFQCSGHGSIQLTGGTMSLGYNQGGVDLANGTVLLAPTFQNNGAITNLTLDGSDLAGTNVLSGTLTWLAGTISDNLTVSSSGALYLSGAGNVYLTGALTNSGQVIWNGSGNWEVYNGGGGNNGLINNLAGGIIDAQCSSTIDSSGTASWFSNAGLFRKSMSASTTTVRLAFTNTGTVTVQSGTLNFDNYNTNCNFGGTFVAGNGTSLNFSDGGTLSGSFTANFDAGINFNGGTFTQTASATFGGVGTVQFNGGTISLPAVPSPNLHLNSGTINLPAGFQGGTITNLTITGVSLSGSNVVTGVLNLQGTLNGPLVVAPGGVVNCNGAYIYNGVTVMPGGTLNVLGPNQTDVTYLTNQGTINWTGGYFQMVYGGGIYNQAGATFNIECDDSLAYYYGTEVLHNDGLVQKFGTTGQTTLQLGLFNTGVVVAQSGTLYCYDYYAANSLGGTFLAAAGATIDFQSGGALTGNFTAAAGGTINLEGGTFTPGPGLVFNGPGTNLLSGGTITLTNSTIPNLQFTGGTVQLTPDFQGGSITNLTLNGASLAGTNLLTGTLNLSGSLTGPLTVASNATLNLGGSIGTYNGQTQLTLQPGATMNWTNGSLFAPLTIPTNSVLNFAGSGSIYVYDPITNFGTMNWTGSSIYLYNYSYYYGYTGQINNQSGAIFNILTNVTGSYGYSVGTFNNAGTVIQAPIAGASSLYWNINNTGLVDVQGGTLNIQGATQPANIGGGTYIAEAGATINFSGGGYLTDEYTAQGGGTMDFSSGTFTNTTSTVLDGVGVYNLNGGTLNLLYDFPANLHLVSGTINPGALYQGGGIANLNLSGLSLGGTNVVTGVLTLTGNVAGPLVVSNNATLNLNGNISYPITVQPGATFNWNGQYNSMTAPVTVAAGAVWNLAQTNGCYLYSLVTNSGTINWTGGYLEFYGYYYYSYNIGIYNLAGGTFNILTDSPIYSYNYYGYGFMENDGTLRKSGTTGINNVPLLMTNTGTIDVESGKIQFASTFQQTGGTWDFGITRAGIYGALGFTGAVPLPANLNVATNGGYVPSLNDSFTLATYSSTSGSIGTTNLPSDGAGWQLNAGSAALTLSAPTLAVPSVSITTPTNTQLFTAPSSVTLAATAVDTNANLSMVQFYFGPTLLGTVTQPQGQTYSYAWHSPAAGAYTIGAVATDANGGLATSAPVNITILSGGSQAVTYTWTNNGTSSASQDWFTPGNWTPNGVPGALDNVILNNGATAVLGHNTSVNNVILSSGTLGGAGALTVTNTFTWTGGNITNTVNNLSSMVINVNGSVGLAGGTLFNLGTVQWLNGNITGSPATAITNASGALWLMQSDRTLALGANYLQTNGLFVNNGTLRKTTTTGTSTYNYLDFINNGTVDAETGAISFNSGGLLAGNYNAATNAVIRFAGGLFTLDAQPSLTGFGSIQFTGGTMTLIHDIAPVLQLTGGQVLLGANFQNSGAITNLTLTGSTLTGSNTITGTLNCNSGALANGTVTVAPSGVLIFGVSNYYYTTSLVNLSLINSGEVLWRGGYLGSGGSAITNNNLWLIQGGYEMTGGILVNNNLIRQTSSGITYIYNQPFVNNGTVDAEAGTIELFGGGTFAGAYNAEAGATVAFSGGSNILGTLPNFTGLGRFQFNGGTLVMTNDIDPALQLTAGSVVLGPLFQGNGTINNLVLAGATLVGTNTVTGNLTVTGGNISGPLTIATNATATFNPGYFYLYTGAAFTNFGSVFCTSNTEYFYAEAAPVYIVNNGLWLDQGTCGYSGSANSPFINNGIYRKEGSSGTTYIEMPLDNAGLFDLRTGTVSLENGGVLGGAFATAAQCTLELYEGTFNPGAPPANFAGPGTVTPYSYATFTLTNDVIPTLPLTGGTVMIGPNFQNNGAITNLTLNGATLGGSNMVSGILNLGSGSTVAGTLTILTNGLLNLSGSGYITLGSGATLINQGVVDWTGGNILTYASTIITNAGVWLAETNGYFYNYYNNYYYYYYYNQTNTHFYNLGTFAKTTAAGTTYFQETAFLNSGTLDVESGTVDFSYVNTYDTNSVTYAQTGATLEFGASAPNLVGRLVLSSNVSLDGTLALNLLNGYTPNLGDEFSLISAQIGLHEAFANFMLPPLTGSRWAVETGPASVQLRVVPTLATASHSSIAGTVMDASANPIPGVTVYATETGAINLIQNGSFEMPAYPANYYYGSYTLISVGSTNLPGWAIVGPTNDNIAIHYDNYLGPAEDGTQYFDPTGLTGGAGISQTFATVPGTTYELVFYHGSYQHYAYNSVLGVAIDTNYYTFGETDGNTSGNLDWRRVQLFFTASSNLTTLTFSDLTGFNADDNFVDNVQVIPPGAGTFAQATTDSSGNYQLTVPNGNYVVGVGGLPQAGYNNVAAQTTAVNGVNPPVNFTTSPLSGGQYFSVSTSVNPPALGNASGGGSGLLVGAPVTVSVTQNANALPYYFAGWTENGVLESTNLNYSFNAYRNRILVANFALPGLAIVASNYPAADGVVSGSGIYTYNSTNVLTAFPYTGYHFLNWTENGTVVSASNPLTNVVTTNHVFVANYGDANPSHIVTITSAPAGLTTGVGAGTYTNGQTAIISAPAAITNNATNLYIFQGFTLGGSPVSAAPAFSKTFSTFDATSVTYVANYQLFTLQPRVINAYDNYANPVPATTGFQVTFQFDRSMRAAPAPLVVLSNTSPTAVQATVGLNGRWFTAIVSNDTYQTPGITFGSNMDGNVNVLISRATDIYGHALTPATNVLGLVVRSTPPPPPVVVLTSPGNGAHLPANSTFTIVGAATSTNVITEVDLYANLAVLARVAYPTPGSPFRVTVTNGLSGGSFALYAVAIDGSGLTGTSMVTHLTVTLPGTTLVDFDLPDASAGPVSGTSLSNYLSTNFGVRLTNVTPGTVVAAVDDQVFLGGGVVQSTSEPNFLAQFGANGPVSYTLLFSNLYASVSWVRPTLIAGTTGASLPAWRAHIFDSMGNELGSTGESALGSFTNLPPANFTLIGGATPNIASIRFDGNNQGASLLSTLPLDDLQLSTIPTNTTLSVTLTRSGTTVAPANVTLNAAIHDSVGTATQVSFYSGTNLVGTVSPTSTTAHAATATLAFNNLAPGSYTFTAVAQDSLGTSSSSTPLAVAVSSVTGLSVINFDALNTSAGGVTGAGLSNYLSTNFGVTLSNVTVGTAMEAVSGGLVAGNGGAVASSAPNYFTQAGLNTPVSFTLVFRSPLQAFGFTRVPLLAGVGGVSHPQWQATLFDANGVVLGSAGEPLIQSATNVPARSFVLSGLNNEGIASVRFDSDSMGTAAFSAVLLDDLILNANTIQPQLSVSLTNSASQSGVQAGTSVTLTAAVNDSLGGSNTVNFYSGGSFVGIGTPGIGASSNQYQYVWANVLPGVYSLRAQVQDSTGVTAYSAPVSVTVNPGGNSQVVNFDSLSTAHGAVSGASLSNYLRGFGIMLSSNITSGAVLSAVNQSSIGGGEVLASSPPNIVTLTGVTGPANYTLNFSNLLASFSFTRPELLANPFVSHPAWQAIAYDAAGVQVAQVGEGLIGSYTNVSAQSFTLSGPGIASVQFASQGSGLTTFNAMLADDLVLTAPATNFPPAVAITSPVTGLQVTAPVNLTVTAAATDTSGIASVSFYANGSPIGTAIASPYAAQLANPGAGGYALTAVALDNNNLMRTSPPVNVTVLPSAFVFGISQQPVGQVAQQGASVTLSVGTTGTGLATYQWYFQPPAAAQPTALTGQTGSTLTIFPMSSATQGNYTVKVTSGNQTLTSSIAEVDLAQPPNITLQPAGQSVQIGANVSLRVAANGTGPFNWQWLLNGALISGATNSTYSILAAQPLNSGSYQVVVGNSTAFVKSAPAAVMVQAGNGTVQTADNFADRIAINPLLGPVYGNNANATAESGEPSYNGNPNIQPAKSIWYTWTASFTGVISLTTAGSDFDTVMAVYTGTNLAHLTRVASDDDSGGFFTSLVNFNVTAGTTYQITVDGFNGASGNVVLGMPSGTGYRVLNPSSGNSVPFIANSGQPTNQLVQAGSTATLIVRATSTLPLTYQWYFQGAPVGTGGTGSTLSIPNFQAGSVGLYYVLVANSVGSVSSQQASIQIAAPNQPGAGGSSQDKFGTAVDLAGGNSTPTSSRVPQSGGGDSRGFSVSQVFSTVGATKEVGEPNHCGQAGGASQWFIYTAPTNGTLDVNTAGSSFNTIVAIYTSPSAQPDFNNLVAQACGFTTNFQLNGQPNVVIPGVLKGTRFFIAVDGYQGASGTVQLHIGLGQAPSLITPPANQFAVAGSNATFSVTAVGSTNFYYQWQLNGVNIAKATNANLTITNAQLGAIGSYTVIVSNVVGVVTSAPPATLTLQTNPVITVQPTNLIVFLGRPASLVTTVVGVSTRTNPLVFQWYTSNTTGNLPVVKATNASLTFPVSQYSNNGSYFMIVSNNYGSDTSAVVNLTVRDTNAPVVLISYPPNLFHTNGSTVTVTGTASDNVGVLSVQVQVGNGAPVTATGTNHWTNVVQLVPGTNLIIAQSMDLAGNLSKPVTNRLVYVARSLFTLQTNGVGRITSTSGATNGAQLIIGSNYTALATSVSNYLFQSWSSGPSGGLLTNRTDGSNLTFLMFTNMVLQANFVTNPFLAVAGSYNGLFYPTNGVGVTEASSGFISATISSNSTGAFSAKVLVDGGSNSISGMFDLTGAAQTNITRLGKPALNVVLNLDTNPADALLAGTVTVAGSGVPAAIHADRALFNTNSNPATNYAGRFTLVFPPAADAPVRSPDGYGYAAITNSLAGVSTMGGALADGSVFTWTAPIAQAGNVPIYLSLYTNKGSFLGWIYFTNSPPQNIGTNSWVNWIKLTNSHTAFYPNGFTNLIVTGIEGSPYTNTMLAGIPILDLTNGTLALSNGNLTNGALVFTNIGTNLASHNLLTNLGGTTTNHLTLSIATNTGVVTLTFRPTGAHADTTAFGVVLQNQTNALGAFVGTNQTGSFILH
jgi:hypothetical protein